MNHLEQQRSRMVEYQLRRRGIEDPAVLSAFQTVRREAFLPEGLGEFAYADSALPLTEGQTISQPYIVALTAEALQLKGGERVLEVGTGSGYAAAILSCLAGSVDTIERVSSLGLSAKERLERLGFSNVRVHVGDGTLGWPKGAPYDAIAVAAGGPKAPRALLGQLAIGGRLVIPIGPTPEAQELTRVTRVSATEYESKRLGSVRFVPLIGAQGFDAAEPEPQLVSPPRRSGQHATVTLLKETAVAIDDIDTVSLDAMLERIGDARVVLIGESTHGTSEFYRMRARLTRELIARRGFNFVAAEADWPDAARVNDFVTGRRRTGHDFVAFDRFPRWMWRNREVHTFIDWLRVANADRQEQKVGFHGLDLYSMYTSMAAVLHSLDGIDPSTAALARRRYGTLTPWQKDPSAYGQAVLTGRYQSAEAAAVAMLQELLKRRLDSLERDGDRFFDAAQNARLVVDAERYYRHLFSGAATSWNLRDSHMFETLRSLLGHYGHGSKGVVWAHNSHVGDAAATEMLVRGEYNIGQLCREAFADQAYLVGMGTDHGTVLAAHDWGGPVHRMEVRPSLPQSHEALFHQVGRPAFSLHLRAPVRAALRDELSARRLSRAIGVVYRPRTERDSHYFDVELARQFDEYLWFDETTALTPFDEAAPVHTQQMPDTYPFGL